MQRKFLEDLGLEKEAIDKIMAENGADINKTKEKLEAERDDYKSQLETATAALKDFEGVDVKEMQTKLATLQADLAKKDAEIQTKLAERDFADNLKAAIMAAGGRSDKAVMAMLNVDELKASKNRDADIKAAIEAVKKDNDYLFQGDKPAPRIVAGTDTTQQDNSDRKAQANEAFRALLGKE